MGRIVLDKVSKSFDKIQVIPPLDLTIEDGEFTVFVGCLLYTSPSPRDVEESRMPSSA